MFILPSYAEAYPQVILESLSRLKPVIVFNEIKFLKKTFSVGVFNSQRNAKDLEKVISRIAINYSKNSKKKFINKKYLHRKIFFIEMNKIFSN